MRTVAAGVMLVLGLAACGGEPADRVAVPGAPSGGDTRPRASTAPTSSSTTLASTTTERAPSASAPSTSAAPTEAAATTPPATTSTATSVASPPPTTAAQPATTLAPTTTVLVYTPEPADGPLRSGVEGPRSLLVQQQLISLAILPATAADSKYGPGTAAAVRRFQDSKGLVVDGVAGPNTLAALTAAVAALTPPTSAA